MQAKLKKTLQDVINKHADTKTDIADIISVLLDEYTKKTGTAYIALMYPLGAFNEFGRLKHPEREIQPAIATSILEASKRRTEFALEYRIAMEQEALKHGFITCA